MNIIEVPERYVELALLRHGTSMLNAGSTVQGEGADPANILHPFGEIEARCVAGLMLCEGLYPVAAITSPLPRARRTGEIVLTLTGSRAEINADLKELCKGRPGEPGALEGLKRIDVETDEYKIRREAEGWDFRYGSIESGGQTMREVGVRTLGALTVFAKTLLTKKIPPRAGWRPVGVAVGHGMALRAAMGQAVGLDMPSTELLKLGNCDMRILRYYPDRANPWDLTDEEFKITAAGTKFKLLG